MQYQRFGNTPLSVSRLSLGTMTFGAKTDLPTAQRITDEALDHGVNLVDTADTYGESETLLGHIFKANNKRDAAFLCTKVYKKHSLNDRIGRNSRINIINALERSLRRLQTDHVDLLQLHHPDPDTPIDETVLALDNLVRAGKVRYVGCSNHYAWQMAYHNATAKQLHAEPLVSVQSAYNLVHRILELEVFHFVRKFNFAVMVYSPLGGGTLARQYDSQHPAEPKGRTAEYKKQLEKSGADIYKILDGLHALAHQHHMPIHHLATLWLLAKPVVSTVLMGGSTPEHFSTLYEIADKTLDPALVQQLDDLTTPAIYAPYKNQPHVTAPALPRL